MSSQNSEKIQKTNLTTCKWFNVRNVQLVKNVCITFHCRYHKKNKITEGTLEVQI